MEQSRKDVALEALRGVAAIIVVFFHAMLGFFPAQSGYFAYFPASDSLMGEPWFGLFNGNAAVGFFFVLSGFVLTRAYFQDGDDTALARGAVKRWPRLAVPVLIAVLISWLLLRYGLYFNKSVAPVTKSAWLYNNFEKADPGFLSALLEGAFLTFFRGDTSYNTVIWTMRIELAGSYVAFGLALIMGRMPRNAFWLVLVAPLIVVLLSHYNAGHLVSFPLGVVLAYIFARRSVALPLWAVGGLLILAAYLLGYTGRAMGAYSFLGGILIDRVDHNYVYVFASVLVIVAVEASAPVRRMLNGRISSFLGELSFPLYLLHVPVLCSAGCYAFLAAMPSSVETARWTAAGVTLLVSMLAAIPLMMLNRAWLTLLNRLTRQAFARVAGPAHPQVAEGLKASEHTDGR